MNMISGCIICTSLHLNYQGETEQDYALAVRDVWHILSDNCLCQAISGNDVVGSCDFLPFCFSMGSKEIRSCFVEQIRSVALSAKQLEVKKQGESVIL